MNEEETLLKEINENLMDMSHLIQNFKFIQNEFRNPISNLESIIQFKSVQDSIYLKNKQKIQSITDHLEKIYFKTNSNVSIDFGKLELNRIEIKNEPIEIVDFDDSSTQMKFAQSKILSFNQKNDLIKLCEFNLDTKWKLIYQASKDGFRAGNFHSKCDDKSPTLTIFRVKHLGYIFGGYTEVKWSQFSEHTLDSNAFIFSLTNKSKRPCKMMTNDPRKSIYRSSSYGPVFGYGDIHIADNSNMTMDSYSNLGYTYTHPKYVYKSKEIVSFLAGSFQFQLDEIEIYVKE